MEKTVIKILGIAPNEKMQSIMQDIAASRDDLTIDTFVGNLHQGVEIVKNNLDKDYDLILSRGETAAMIKAFSPIPVLEIAYSFYDILHAVKLAETFHTKFAILGFPSVTSCAYQLRDMLQMDLDIFTLYDSDEAPAIIQDLKEKGYQMIITGMCIDYVVRRYGLSHIPIISSEESVRNTIDQALSLCTGYVVLKHQYQLLDHIIRSSTNDTLVYDQQQELVYSSVRYMNADTAAALTQKDLTSLDKADIDMVKQRGSSLIQSSKRIIRNGEGSYTAFYLKPQKTHLPSSKNDILYYTRAEAGEIYLKHFNEIFQTNYESDYSLEQMVSAPLPIIFTGETGTGKEQLAAYIYAQGTWSNHPFVVIDFSSLSDKSWNFLTTHIDSPLNSNKYTIYFRGLEYLTSQKFERLITLIRDSNLCSRNRILFSYATAPGKKVTSAVSRLINLFSCICVNLPPLRMHPESIPTLSSLYISTLNVDLARHVISFTDEAMKLLQEYSWPNNLNQFRRVISNLVAVSPTSYIQKEPVRKALAEENRNTTMPMTLPDSLNLKKPLAEIEKDIIKAVLAETGGNQSQAALRLGICRTTLWRILNKS